MCDFLGPKNINFLIRETLKIYPGVPAKVVAPKLQAMASDWYSYQEDRYGKHLSDLNDKFMHDIIMSGPMFASADTMGVPYCPENRGCGYQQSSEINSSCPPTFLCNIPIYYRERPTVINDGYTWKGAPPSEYEKYMRDQLMFGNPDWDAVLMKYASPTTKFAINQKLIRHNARKGFTHGMAVRAPQGGLDGEEICDSLPISPPKRLCGRCMDWTAQCTIPYANYVATCDKKNEPHITAGTI